MEARVLGAALRSFTRRPIRQSDVPPGWRRFGASSASYANVVVMLLVLLLIEAPAVHMLVGALMEDGALRAVVRGLLLGSSVYLAVWLIGDLRLLRESSGVLLGENGLSVQLGGRCHGLVPLESVVSAQQLAEQSAAPGADADSIRITPLQPPNCRLTLRSPVTLQLPFGLAAQVTRLDLFVDEPSAFSCAIRMHHSRALTTH